MKKLAFLPVVRHLIWAVFGRPDVPPRAFKVRIKANEPLRIRTKIALLYLDYVEVEDIAKAFSLTRERVRQLLWVSYNEAIKNDIIKK